MILKLEQQKFCIKIFFNLKIANDLADALKTLFIQNIFYLFQKLIYCIRALIAWVIKGNCFNKLFLAKLLILIKLLYELFFLIQI